MPMYWMNLFLYFITLYIMIMIIISFLILPYNKPTSSNKLNFKINNKIIKMLI